MPAWNATQASAHGHSTHHGHVARTHRDTLARGQRVGMIKFGSRTDVIFPAAATVSVKAGDRVKGGASVLAEYSVPQTMTITPARKPTEVVP